MDEKELRKKSIHPSIHPFILSFFYQFFSPSIFSPFPSLPICSVFMVSFDLVMTNEMYEVCLWGIRNIYKGEAFKEKSPSSLLTLDSVRRGCDEWSGSSHLATMRRDI